MSSDSTATQEVSESQPDFRVTMDHGVDLGEVADVGEYRLDRAAATGQAVQRRVQ